MKIYFKLDRYVFFADKEQNLLTAFYNDENNIMYIGNSKIYDVLTKEGIAYFVKELMERKIDTVMQRAVNNKKLFNKYLREFEERTNSFFVDEYKFIGTVTHYIEKSTVELCIIPSLLEFNTVFLEKGIFIVKLFKNREGVTEEEVKKANYFIDVTNSQINRIREVFKDKNKVQSAV